MNFILLYNNLFAAALEDCSHIIDDPASILKCINDILGATDCQVLFSLSCVSIFEIFLTQNGHRA